MAWKGLLPPGCVAALMGHHLGLVSTPQLMHTFSPGFTFVEPSGATPLRCAPAPLFTVVVVVDSRRSPGCRAVADIFAAIVIVLALRTVPVKVKSACLYV